MKGGMQKQYTGTAEEPLFFLCLVCKARPCYCLDAPSFPRLKMQLVFPFLPYYMKCCPNWTFFFFGSAAFILYSPLCKNSVLRHSPRRLCVLVD